MCRIIRKQNKHNRIVSFESVNNNVYILCRLLFREYNNKYGLLTDETLKLLTRWDMEIGTAKIFDDEDFKQLKNLILNDDGWSADYDKNFIQVYTKSVENSTFKMVKVRTDFRGISAQDLYDVLHDPDYRKVWDHSMIESVDIGYLNPNNDVSYYAVSCPAPLKNRDFVLHRSWLDTGQEQVILNHSVFHKDFPPKKGFIRALSYLTGYLISSTKSGCSFGYVSRTDPQGAIPAWLVNKCTQILAPKYIRQIEKAVLSYPSWKSSHYPNFKPWYYPEQNSSPKILLDDCVPSEIELRNNPELKFPKFQRNKNSVKEKKAPIMETPSCSKEASSPDGTSIEKSSIVERANSVSKDSSHRHSTLSNDKKAVSLQSDLHKVDVNVKKNAKEKFISCINFITICKRRSSSEIASLDT